MELSCVWCAHAIDRRLRAKMCSGELHYGTPVLQPLIYVDVAERKEVTRARYLPNSFPFPSLRMEFYSVTILTEISTVWGRLTRVARPVLFYLEFSWLLKVLTASCLLPSAVQSALCVQHLLPPADRTKSTLAIWLNATMISLSHPYPHRLDIRGFPRGHACTFASI